MLDTLEINITPNTVTSIHCISMTTCCHCLLGRSVLLLIVVDHLIQFTILDPDGVKVQLAQSELRDHSLLLLLETTSKVTGENEENQQLEKLAADLVVLLLTGGRMEHLEIDIVIVICTGSRKL